MAKGPSSVLATGNIPAVYQASSTTLTFRGNAIDVISAGAGNQNVSTLEMPNATVGTHLVICGTDDTKTVTLIAGGNMRVQGSLVLSAGKAAHFIARKLSGSIVWCQVGAGVVDVSAATIPDDLDLGASGTAGSLDVFPATASRGKLSIVAANSAGNTTTTVTNASQAAARIYTIPDAGTDASFVMTAGNQSIAGIKTFTNSPLFSASATFSQFSTNFASDTLVISNNASEGPRFRLFEQTINVTGTPASIDLNANLPANSVIVSAQMTFPVAVSMTTATKVGIGTAADPDKYGLSAALTQHTKTNFVPASFSFSTSAEDVQLFACDNSGAAAGTFNNAGQIRVKILALVLTDLVN